MKANMLSNSKHQHRAGGRAGASRHLTGRAVLIWLLSFFGVVIAVNMLMAKLAIDTMPGTQVDSSYQEGNQYNAEIAAARSQEARHWQVQGHVARGIDGRARVEIVARDQQGHALSGLWISAQLERPTDKRDDRNLALIERDPGTYQGEAIDLAPGQWDLVLAATRGGERLFLSRNRVILK